MTRIDGNVLVNASSLYDIADAIRSKSGDDSLLIPADMANAIRSITGGGGGAKNILSGTSMPTASQGEDGDIYLMHTTFARTYGSCIASAYDSSGTDFLPSGNNSGWRYEMVFRINAVNANTFYLFGGVNSFSSNTGWYAVGFNGGADGKLLAYQSAGNANTRQSWISNISQNQLIDGIFHRVVLDGSELYLDGTLLHDFGITPGVTRAVSLFGLWKGDVSSNIYLPSSNVDIQSLVVADSGNTVYDIRPRESAGVVSMVDTITGTVLNTYGTAANFEMRTGIDPVLVKVNGEWVTLIGQDIDDVDTEGSGGGGLSKDLLLTVDQSTGGAWVDTQIDVSGMDVLLFEAYSATDDFRRGIIIEVSEIAVYTGSTDVYTPIHGIGSDFNARIYNGILNASYRYTGAATNYTKIYNYVDSGIGD